MRTVWMGVFYGVLHEGFNNVEEISLRAYLGINRGV